MQKERTIYLFGSPEFVFCVQVPLMMSKRKKKKKGKCREASDNNKIASVCRLKFAILS